MNIWDGNAIDSPGSCRWMESTLISKGWYRVHKRTFLSFLDLVVYRFHTWTPCWLIFPISCLGLWKLRLPSQEAMNKKFHVFSAKSIISSVTHISVGGRTTQWPGEASENTQALAHWFQIIRLFPLRSLFLFQDFICTYEGPFNPICKMMNYMCRKQYITGSRSLSIYSHSLNTYFTQYSNMRNCKHKAWAVIVSCIQASNLNIGIHE